MSMVWRLESSWVYLTLFINDSCTIFLLPVEYCNWFYDIIWYILLSILSWPMIPTQYSCFVLTPTCNCFSLLFVECRKRVIVFNSTATLASLHQVGSQGELMLLAWTGSSSSCLDALKFWHGLDVYYFSFLNILRFSILRIDVLVVMTSRLWE